MEFYEIIKNHSNKYPNMKPADVVKLVYQNEFGGGHLIKDADRSLKMIRKELAECGIVRSEKLLQPIGNGLSRLYLSSAEAKNMDPAYINDIFVSSAQIHKGSSSSFKEKLNILTDRFDYFGFGFELEDLQEYLKDYAESGYPMVSHTDTYRNAYLPAYRVVKDSLCYMLQGEKLWEEREIYVPHGNYGIWCKQYIPSTYSGKPLPLVILSHGMDDSYMSCEPYAIDMASKGIAACCLEFYGGGGKKTGGSTREMSIMTETEELKAVLAAARTWDFADPERIVLFGESQGAIVSAFTAAERPDQVHGLVLCYPAFVIFDNAHEQYGSKEEIPEEYMFRWLKAGHLFFYDIWDIDPYRKASAYTKHTLIMHGNADFTVPISYSEKAYQTYKDSEYYVINGAKHGFRGRAFDVALDHIYGYFRTIGIM